MKKFLLPALAVSALLLNSCSTTQLARQTDSGDDVYYTEAKAKVITPVVTGSQSYTQESDTQEEQSYRTDEQLYGDERYSDNRSEDDYSYSARINRFYYNSPYRPYYDYGYNPWYTYSYDPFFYDPWLFRPGVSIWISTGRYYSRPWHNRYYGYYGSGYNNGFWGPYSYYNTYPGYGYGGYYGGRTGYRNPDLRPRPDRESGIGRSGNLGNPGGNVNIPSAERPNRGSSVPNRRSPNGAISSDKGNSTSSKPSSSGSVRPSRTKEANNQPPRQVAPAAPRPERSAAPAPSSSGSSSSNGNSSSGGNSNGSSGSRPARGGR